MRNPGEVDLGYGVDGYAYVTADGENENPYIHAAALDPDGGFSISYRSFGQGNEFFFIRLTPGGMFDDETGHKLIAGDTDGFARRGRLTRSVDGSHIMQYLRSYQEDNSSIGSVAIGHYLPSLDAKPSFGTQGIVHLMPDNSVSDKAVALKGYLDAVEMPVLNSPPPRRKINIAESNVHKRSAFAEDIANVVTRYPLRSQLVDGVVRTLYMSVRNENVEEIASWIALHDPLTGAPVRGLGDDRSKSQVNLPPLSYGVADYPPETQDCWFLADGSAILVVRLNDWYVGLVRVNLQGLYDQDFGLVSTATAFSQYTRLAVDENNDRIVVIGANHPQNPHALLVRVHHLNGLRDDSFGTRGQNEYFFGGNPNAIVGIAIDNEQRIYIGTQQFVDGKRQAFVTRLLSDGEVDTTFGTEGHFRSSDFILTDVIYGNGRLMLLGSDDMADFAMRLHT